MIIFSKKSIFEILYRVFVNDCEKFEMICQKLRGVFHVGVKIRFLFFRFLGFYYNFVFVPIFSTFTLILFLF